MTKVIVLSTVLGLSALGMACGDSGTNVNVNAKPANVATPAPVATVAPATPAATVATNANMANSANKMAPAPNKMSNVKPAANMPKGTATPKS